MREGIAPAFSGLPSQDFFHVRLSDHGNLRRDGQFAGVITRRMRCASALLRPADSKALLAPDGAVHRPTLSGRHL